MHPLLFISALLCLLLSSHSHAQSPRKVLPQTIEQKTNTPPIPKHNTAQYGLAFIFSAQCPYCHAFAPTLQTFARETGLTVYPFSVDGRGLAQYPHPLTATQEIVQTFYHSTTNVTYPALFLVNLQNRKHVTLSLGNVPLSALNITYQASLTYPHLKAQLQ
ncbi:conjugal transfer protein TraF [Photobacterium leiognathi]|uniref:conjugal transfer protein TraF n=1 Tax=Photobacterium leiognathi TaxID=553611 RepID=UPI002739E4F4|nr:conjugal transfer protein TraF [Photobacterium leiognathi]